LNTVYGEKGAPVHTHDDFRIEIKQALLEQEVHRGVNGARLRINVSSFEPSYRIQRCISR